MTKHRHMKVEDTDNPNVVMVGGLGPWCKDPKCPEKDFPVDADGLPISKSAYGFQISQDPFRVVCEPCAMGHHAECVLYNCGCRTFARAHVEAKEARRFRPKGGAA